MVLGYKLFMKWYTTTFVPFLGGENLEKIHVKHSGLEPKNRKKIDLLSYDFIRLLIV